MGEYVLFPLRSKCATLYPFVETLELRKLYVDYLVQC